MSHIHIYTKQYHNIFIWVTTIKGCLEAYTKHKDSNQSVFFVQSDQGLPCSLYIFFTTCDQTEVQTDLSLPFAYAKRQLLSSQSPFMQYIHYYVFSIYNIYRLTNIYVQNYGLCYYLQLIVSNKFPFLCRIIFTSLCQRARYRKSGNDWHVMSDMKKKVQIIRSYPLKH